MVKGSKDKMLREPDAKSKGALRAFLFPDLGVTVLAASADEAAALAAEKVAAKN